MILAFYKATGPGMQGVYDVGTRFWTKGKYSHVEVIFKDGLAASSSFLDNGVRFKRIEFNPEHWDFVDISSLGYDESQVRDWFNSHEGLGYDTLGISRFIIGPISQDKDKWFCTEAIASALGFHEAWRFDPNLLAAIFKLV